MSTPINSTDDDFRLSLPIFRHSVERNCPSALSLTSTYDYIDKSCQQLEFGWKDSIKMHCIIDDRSTSSRDVLSCAGAHQLYTSKSLSIVSFCMFKYPVTDIFKGDGFTRLAFDIIIAASKMVAIILSVTDHGL